MIVLHGITHYKFCRLLNYCEPVGGHKILARGRLPFLLLCVALRDKIIIEEKYNIVCSNHSDNSECI